MKTSNKEERSANSAFREGFLSIFDFSLTPHRYQGRSSNVRSIEEARKADAEALRSDWSQIGIDIYNAGKHSEK